MLEGCCLNMLNVTTVDVGDGILYCEGVTISYKRSGDAILIYSFWQAQLQFGGVPDGV